METRTVEVITSKSTLHLLVTWFPAKVEFKNLQTPARDSLLQPPYRLLPPQLTAQTLF